MATAALDPRTFLEIIPARLFWTCTDSVSQDTDTHHYFSIDDELRYEPFMYDFGPLNLLEVFRYCMLLESKLKQTDFAGKAIVHYCSTSADKRANAACLICLYRVIVMRISTAEAIAPFNGIQPPLLPFRDASNLATCNYNMTVEDCLWGAEYAIRLGWLDWPTFDYKAYDYLDRFDVCGMNWIVPGKFLAFASPSSFYLMDDGSPTHTPEQYSGIFNALGINLVVRLNRKQYDRQRFINCGIKHVDLFFKDGTCPSDEIMSAFLHVSHREAGGIAVHCKAGLGRTCTLIGLYAMKHYQFPARAFIGWNRLCRPGSILGPQQQFLVDMQQEMFQAGATLLGPSVSLPLPRIATTPPCGRNNRPGNCKMQTPSKPAIPNHEDAGQGERLCNAAMRRRWLKNCKDICVESDCGRTKDTVGPVLLGRFPRFDWQSELEEHVSRKEAEYANLGCNKPPSVAKRYSF